MSNKLILDTSAWVEYLAGSERGCKVKEIINKPNMLILTTGLIAAELMAKYIKENKPEQDAFEALRALAIMIPFDMVLGANAARLYVMHRKTRKKFGLADAHILAAAQTHKARIITCDTDFMDIQNVTVIR